MINKFIIQVCCTLLYCSSCKVKKITHSNPVIIYQVFDSLENLLCNYIDRIDNVNRDSVCILIEPAGDFTLNEDEEGKYNVFKERRYIYNVRVFHTYYYNKDTTLIKSNRKIKICNKLYPIYFPRIDDVFCCFKNVVFPRNRLSQDFDIYNTRYYKVDMAKKKVIGFF